MIVKLWHQKQKNAIYPHIFITSQLAIPSGDSSGLISRRNDRETDSLDKMIVSTIRDREHDLGDRVDDPRDREIDLGDRGDDSMIVRW